MVRCGTFEIYLCYQGRRWPPTQFGYSQDDHCRDGHLTTSKSGKTRDGFVSNAWQLDRKRSVAIVELSSHHPNSDKRLCETAILRCRSRCLHQRATGIRATTPSLRSGWKLHSPQRKDAAARPRRSLGVTPDGRAISDRAGR